LKTIGLLGGMSWESSIEYYRIINETVRARLGGLHSAKSVMFSVDFADIERFQHSGQWDRATNMLIEAARAIELAGADFLVICTNTMHKMADEVCKAIGIPLLHIADPTAEQIKAKGLRTVGLLGTEFTMEGDFYKGRLAEVHGLQVVIPTPADRNTTNRVIYEELVVGKIVPESKTRYRRIIADLVRHGAQGVILGCTEIGLLIGQEDSPVPLFDTARIHAAAAVDYALETSDF